VLWKASRSSETNLFHGRRNLHTKLVAPGIVREMLEMILPRAGSTKLGDGEQRGKNMIVMILKRARNTMAN
jgi:hypothetical protein